MENFTPVSALLGGTLVGAGALLLYVTIGRIAGISGIAKSALLERSGSAWRWLFVLGLIAGPLLVSLVQPGFSYSTPVLNGTTVVAGLLVGLGTAWGSGCTSGHGVCGMSRLSPRSIAATLIFMAAGVLVASLVHGILA